MDGNITRVRYSIGCSKVSLKQEFIQVILFKRT